MKLESENVKITFFYTKLLEVAFSSEMPKTHYLLHIRHYHSSGNIKDSPTYQV